MTALPEYQLLESTGRYFDGETAAPREVIVKFGDASLILMRGDGTPIAHWSLAGLRDFGAGKGALSLAPGDASDERLVVEDGDMTSAIRAVAPSLHRRARRSRGGRWRLIFWALAAAASVWLVLFVLAPRLSDRLAGLVPPEAEVRMGAEMEGQFARLVAGEGARFCEGGPGGAALDRLARRLADGAGAHVPVSVRVLDHEMVNAFALPGGRIIVFRGLLRAAESPEALAGVIAHELGHVVRRDPTRLALRAAGTAGIVGLLLGDFTGATATVALAEALIRSGYQREAEAEADAFAARLLAGEGLPTPPLAGFLRGLQEGEGEGPGLLSHLASHPDPEGRARAIEAADTIGDRPFEPALDDQGWVALRNICR